jgi:photosystem II reaction center protein PsbP
MKRQCTCTLLLLLTIVACCFGQTRSGGRDIYRNRTDQFQIALPNDWTVTESQRGVSVEAINHRGASINVSVGPYNRHDPTLRELNQMLELGAAQTKREYPTAIILEKGLRLLSGKRGPYQKYRVTYTVGAQSATNIVANYTVFKNARVYTITISAPVNEYPETEPLLRASVNSFLIR